MAEALSAKAIAASSVIIVGVARNCAATIGETIQALELASAGFRKRKFLVVESDSEDETLAELRRLEGEHDLVASTEGRLQGVMPLRTERIAHCRNVLRDRVAGSPELETDFVIMADMDGVNGSVTREALESCWALAVPWDVVCANQPDGYYDVWALRHRHWSPNDCWTAVRSIAPYIGENAAIETFVRARQVRIPPECPPLEVDSAFGGLAIYTRAAFLAGRYEGQTMTGNEICEHVPFHAGLRDAGMRIWINPALVNKTQLEHIRGDSLRRIFADSWRRLKSL